MFSFEILTMFMEFDKMFKHHFVHIRKTVIMGFVLTKLYF